MDANDFYARDLVDALKAEGIANIIIEQTGGGTATFYIDNGPEHEVMAIGPGAYNWTNPGMSEFSTDELSYAMSYLDRNDNYVVPEPDNFYIAPGTPLQEAARQIAAKYREINK